MTTKAKQVKRKAHERPAVPLPAGTLVLLNKDQVASAIGVSVRTLDAMIAAKGYPPPDNRIGQLPRWRLDTHNAWYEKAFPASKE